MALLDIDVFVLTEVPISIPFRYYLLLSLQKNAISAFLRGRRDPIYRVPSGVGGPTLVNREGHWTSGWCAPPLHPAGRDKSGPYAW